MGAVSLTGADTVTLNNRVFADFADANYGELTFPNDIAGVKTGKNQNSIYAENATGRQCEFKLRILRGSSDDKFMNGLLSQQLANFSATVLLIGQFIKKVGDGQGNIASDIYNVSGGVFTKQVEAKSNAEGDIEQSVAIYMMKFTLAPRSIT